MCKCRHVKRHFGRNQSAGCAGIFVQLIYSNLSIFLTVTRKRIYIILIVMNIRQTFLCNIDHADLITIDINPSDPSSVSQRPTTSLFIAETSKAKWVNTLKNWLRGWDSREGFTSEPGGILVWGMPPKHSSLFCHFGNSFLAMRLHLNVLYGWNSCSVDLRGLVV